MEAGFKGNTRITEILIYAGAEMEALHDAVFGCQLEAVNLLLYRNINVNGKSKAGWTPLRLAAGIWTDGVAPLLQKNALELFFLGIDTTDLKIDDESIDTVKQGYLMLYEWFRNCDSEIRTRNIDGMII
ncbi:Hypothetical predicted protein [Octopus vulgaris]|uniref:Uncharacterized protein n=1 Tax=Octopus vulgaris TaxID=6645 RepID=A0AA36F4L5_OCTVU|nr:Hypothetical predicted protein [Octopus vulgaris]